MSSFLPAHKNFPIWRKSTFRYEFEWRDDNGKVAKPHDLSGYTGTCRIEPLPGQLGSAIELTTSNGGIILGGFATSEPRNGLIELFISKGQVEAILWKKASYTLYLVEPNPPHDDYPLLTGRFTIAGPPL